jgi:outer membrane protein OmpA-like peptidoglycan-associated protein/tetratricopeptide (TPR) repeat protein
MKNIFTIFALSIITMSVYGQRKYYDVGNEFFEKRMYAEAIENYKLEMNEDVVYNQDEMVEKIAITYKMLFEYENAEKWYAELIKTNPKDNIHYFDYGNILRSNSKYEEAKKVFLLFEEKSGNKALATTYIQYCDWAIANLAISNDAFTVTQTNIETGSRSIGQIPYKDGLIYAAPQIQDFNNKTAYYDLAYSEKTDPVSFAAPQKLAGEVDFSFYEGAPSLNADNSIMYFTGNSSESVKYRDRQVNKGKIEISKSGVNILKIYQVEFKDDKWVNRKEVSINSNSYDCVFPHITEDGKSLYFSSNMEGGNGGFDIYRADLNTDGTWSKPTNLGEGVNSAFDELYPFTFEGQLYFSSKGKGGFGGADIYSGTIGATDFANIGQPFNTAKDDFAYTAFRENGAVKGYLSSNRIGPNGYDYIFYFEESVTKMDTLQTFALNKFTDEPIKDVRISLEKNTGEEELHNEIDTTDAEGNVVFLLEQNVAYTVTIAPANFDALTFEIPADNRDDIIGKFGKKEVTSTYEETTTSSTEETPKVGEIITYNKIYFDYDKWNIRKDAIPEMEKMLTYLNKYPDVKVEISAHTDCRGSDEYNERLSKRRAKSARKYLIDKGISAQRMTEKGYGEYKLSNKCSDDVECTEAEHQANRRMEMFILE